MTAVIKRFYPFSVGIVFVTLLALLGAAPLRAQVFDPHDEAEAAILNNVDRYFEQVHADWHIPGMVISIVKDGRLVYARGIGVRDLDHPELPVDEHTHFKIASVSKAFTPVLVAQLVDEGKVDWNTRVREILPEFRLKDSVASELITVKDLFQHCSGLKAGQGSYLPRLGYGREAIFTVLPYLEPEYPFRSGYAYQTFFYAVNALLVERLTGQSWEEAIRTRIFEPLGMAETTTGAEGLLACENRAQSHDAKVVEGAIVATPIPYEDQPLNRLSVISASGGIISTVTDMAKWLQFHLAEGLLPDSTRLVSLTQMRKVHRGENPQSQNDSVVTVYGYGWHVEYGPKGKLYWHTGSGFGHTDICFWRPDLQLGCMISCNADGLTGARRALMRRIIDLYLGLPDTDYSARELAALLRTEARKKPAEAPKDPKPAPDSQTLVGTYRNTIGLGEAVVALEGEQLYITLGPKGWTHRLEPVSGRKFRFKSEGHWFPVTFLRNKESGKIDSFRLQFGHGEDFGTWTRID